MLFLTVPPLHHSLDIATNIVKANESSRKEVLPTLLNYFRQEKITGSARNININSDRENAISEPAADSNPQGQTIQFEINSTNLPNARNFANENSSFPSTISEGYQAVHAQARVSNRNHNSSSLLLNLRVPPPRNLDRPSLATNSNISGEPPPITEGAQNDSQLEHELRNRNHLSDNQGTPTNEISAENSRERNSSYEKNLNIQSNNNDVDIDSSSDASSESETVFQNSSSNDGTYGLFHTHFDGAEILTGQEDANAGIFEEDDDTPSLADNSDEDSDNESDPATCNENEADQSEEEVQNQSKNGLPGWNYNKQNLFFNINVDDVDKKLAKNYIQEVNVIVEKVIHEHTLVDGSKTTNSASIPLNKIPSPLQVLKLFLPNSILEFVRERVTRVLSQKQLPPVTTTELLSIIIFHTQCAFYGESAKTVCQKNENGFYLDMEISYKRYLSVWAALSGSSERNTNEISTTGWTAKPSGTSTILSLEQQLAAVNRSPLFIPNATICSLDDDHIRMSSRSVTQLTNLRSVNNPKKALGPVNNAICSALTSVYLVGHFSRNGEKNIDIWQRLVMLLQGEATLGCLNPMTDTIFASDRAYNCKESIKFINETLGATGIGTHKRGYSFPFTWGEVRPRKKYKGNTVSEKGCRAVYSANCNIRSQSGKTIQAIVYRQSFSGRIAAVYHNDTSLFSADNFSLVPKDTYRSAVSDTKINRRQIVFEKNRESSTTSNISRLESSKANIEKVLHGIKQLTYLQSEDPAWFLLRAFSFTSRTAASFVRAFCSDFDVHILVLHTMIKRLAPEIRTTIIPSHISNSSSYYNEIWCSVIRCLGFSRMTVYRQSTADLRNEILALSLESANLLNVEKLRSILTIAGRKPPSRSRKATLITLILQLKEDIINGDTILEGDVFQEDDGGEEIHIDKEEKR